MGFGLRIAPGVRVSASSRGLRTSIGPRAARIHVGAGGPGFSTGAGPLTYWTGAGGGSRGGRRSVASYEREMRQLEREQALEDAAAHQQLLDEFIRAHEQYFPPAEPPTVSPAQPVSVGELYKRAWAEEKRGLSIFKRQERQAAKARARARAEAGAGLEERRRMAAAQEEQARLDTAWQRLLDNDEEMVLATLEAAFEDNESPAAATAVVGSAVSIVMRFPSLGHVVPEKRPDLTPTGRPTLKKRPKAELHRLYLLALMAHVLVTVKEAFAVAPGLTEANVLVVQGQEDTAFPRVTPIFAARLERDALAGVPWEETDAADIMGAKASAALLSTKGKAQEIQPLDLSDEPALAEAAEQLADQLGWELDPALV
jgi:hypothetical protein